MAFACVLLLGALVIHLGFGDHGLAAGGTGGDDEVVTRYSVSLLNRELFSFSISRTVDHSHD